MDGKQSSRDRIITYQVPEEFTGHKTAEFLRKKGWSRQDMTELKKRGISARLEDQEIRFGQRFSGPGQLSIRVPADENSSDIQPEPVPLDVVYEDRDLLVVHKPAGMAVHPTLRHPCGSLGNAVMHYYRQQGVPFVYRPVHRLDKDTSGLLLIARHFVSASILYQEMLDKKITKEYLAIAVDGGLADQGTIRLPIRREREGSVRRVADPQKGQPACTHYRVLERAGSHALVQLRLETGRTHQIRVHMSAIGHPLLGDGLYGSGEDGFDRQALHAFRLTFPHPITGEILTLEAPLPEDMRKWLSASLTQF